MNDNLILGYIFEHRHLSLL